MADITVTAANVTLVSGPTETRNSTGTTAVGDLVYADSSTTVEVASNDDAATDAVVGIALNAATAGQPVTYAKDTAVVGFGAVLTVTETYVLSASGAFSPVGDIATSDWVTRLGYGITTSNLQVDIAVMSLQAP